MNYGNQMKKIITVVGARPQFIKAAVVSRILQNDPDMHEILVHTGQHYDANMSQIFFNELNLPTPHYHLGIGSHQHGKQTGDMLAAIEVLLLKEKPDCVLIYGDTNSTLAGALAAAKLHIPVAHVEAGLRTFDRKMPEEVNRIIADQLSTWLFTPTEQAIINLNQEGYADSRIIPVGDVMYDAALFYIEKAVQTSHILQQLNYQPKEYILATIHRAENTNDPNALKTLFQTLDQLARTKPVVMPLHPRTKQILNNHDPSLLTNSLIQIIEPVGFLDMIMLEKHAALIMTDSGGIQKEAFFYQVPCITLRNQPTEWIETVALGWNKIVSPSDADGVLTAAMNALNSRGIENQFPFGRGNAGNLIVDFLKKGMIDAHLDH